MLHEEQSGGRSSKSVKQNMKERNLLQLIFDSEIQIAKTLFFPFSAQEIHRKY